MKMKLMKYKKRKISVFNILKVKKLYFHKYKIQSIKLDLNIPIDNQSLAIDISFMENSFQMILIKNTPGMKINKNGVIFLSIDNKDKII